MAQHLTDKTAREAAAPTAGYTITNDDEVSGFGLLVTAGGARSWVYRYRHNRLTRRYTIGAFPSWKAATARRRAEELTRLVDQGRDPQREKQAAREAPTVAELCDRYVEEHAVKKRSAADDKRMIERIIKPALGSRKVAEIEFRDIDHLHRRITTRGGSGKRAKGSPYAANRVLSLTSKMLSLAIRWKMRADNPAKGVGRNAESPIERHLKKDELERLLSTLAAWSDQQVVDIVYLLMERVVGRASCLPPPGLNSKNRDGGLNLRATLSCKRNTPCRFPGPPNCGSIGCANHRHPHFCSLARVSATSRQSINPGRKSARQRKSKGGSVFTICGTALRHSWLPTVGIY
jgi:Arm DNA-binding domain